MEEIIKKIVYVFTTAIWAILGLLFWIPLLLRVITAYAVSIIYNMVSESDANIEKTRTSLTYAIGFYAEGFYRIENSLSEETPFNNQAPRIDKSSSSITSFLSNLLWTIVFWGVLIIPFIDNPLTSITQVFSSDKEVKIEGFNPYEMPIIRNTYEPDDLDIKRFSIKPDTKYKISNRDLLQGKVLSYSPDGSRAAYPILARWSSKSGRIISTDITYDWGTIKKSLTGFGHNWIMDLDSLVVSYKAGQPNFFKNGTSVESATLLLIYERD